MKTNKIQGKSVVDYETVLSLYNRKTLCINKFKTYINEKNRINHILFDFYAKQLFRKLKFGRHINIKRNEQRMIRDFRKMYGNPENVVICIGDWEQRQQMNTKNQL